MRSARVTLAVVLAACAPKAKEPAARALPIASAKPEASDGATLPEPPAAEAWRRAEKVELSGAPALGCGGASIAGWLRVECPRRSFFGAELASITLHRAPPGGRVVGEVLLTPFAEGARVEASFVWKNEDVFRFEARPGSRSGFPAAPAGEAKTILEAMCRCEPRSVPSGGLGEFGCRADPHRLDAGSGWPAACVRHVSEGADCDDMNVCLTMEPNHYRICGAGEVLTGGHPFRVCRVACDASAPCPAGFDCTPSEQMAESGLVPGPEICVPKE